MFYLLAGEQYAHLFNTNKQMGRFLPVFNVLTGLVKKKTTTKNPSINKRKTPKRLLLKTFAFEVFHILV